MDNEKVIGEAFDAGDEVVVTVYPGLFFLLPVDHNCDSMGCGQRHVMYRFPKALAAHQSGKA